jgi:hypothetical protein
MTKAKSKLTAKSKAQAKTSAVDVVEKTPPVPPVNHSEKTENSKALPDPALRSIITEDGFAMGIVPSEAFNEDGTFTLSNCLLYKDGSIAISQLESVLAHARQFYNQQLYSTGFAEGRLSESSDGSKSSKSRKDVK